MKKRWLLAVVPAFGVGVAVGYKFGVAMVEDFLVGGLISRVPESQIKRF